MIIFVFGIVFRFVRIILFCFCTIVAFITSILGIGCILLTDYVGLFLWFGYVLSVCLRVRLPIIVLPSATAYSCQQ